MTCQLVMFAHASVDVVGSIAVRNAQIVTLLPETLKRPVCTMASRLS